MPAVLFCKDKATHAMNKRCATLFYPLRNTVARYFDLPAMRSTAGQVLQKTTTYTTYYFSHHAAPRPNAGTTIHNVYTATKNTVDTALFAEHSPYQVLSACQFYPVIYWVTYRVTYNYSMYFCKR